MARKPKGYWTKERCHEEALKYETRQSFHAGSYGAYKVAIRNKWLDEVCSHMPKRHGKWNVKETVCEEAKKYKTRGAFKNGSCGAWAAAQRYGWLDEVCSHMTVLKATNGFWTKERCHEEALKYETRYSYFSGCGSSYQAAFKKGWLDDICSHMIHGNTIKVSKWKCTHDIRMEALKYNTKEEFKHGSGGAYAAARRHGILNEICSHMSAKGQSMSDPCVVYEFVLQLENGKCLIYVGIAEAVMAGKNIDVSKTLKKRYSVRGKEVQHKLFVNYGIYPVICSDITTREDALEQERLRIISYAEEGHYVVNTIHNPMKLEEKEVVEILNYNSVHGHRDWEERVGFYESSRHRWTRSAVETEAYKYNRKSDFRKGNQNAYAAAHRNGWLDEVCSHMTEMKTPNGYWTKERVWEEASKYNTRNEFLKNSSGACHAAQRNGWMDEVCSHMVCGRSRPRKWTKEKVQSESLKYSSRGAFQKGSGGAYDAARKNGWLDEFFPKK